MLNLGRNYDPQVKCVVDQVRNWLWIYGTLDGAEKTRTVRAWRKCNEHLMKTINGEPQPFRRVRGPMGATIAMLHEIGWKTGGPGVWTDRDGCKWRYDAGSPACLIRAIRQHAELKVWTKAAQHHCGGGLDLGADLTVLIKHIKYYRDKGKQAKATLLQTIAAGGAWTNDRKHKAGLVESPACQLCGAEQQTDHHLFWICPRTRECEAEICLLYTSPSPRD